MPAFISSIFGVTEPAIYGITLPMKIPFYISCVVSGLIGAGLSFFDLKNYAMGALGIFMYPGYVSPKDGMTPMFIMMAFTLAAILVSFALQMIAPVPYLYGGQEGDDATSAIEEISDITPLKDIKQEIIASPLSGQLVPLAEVPDEVFASGAMGKGIAINPSEGIIYAPTNAEVILVFATKHAIGLKTENGADLLIHVGMDTVSLGGNGFNALVKVGEKVAAGQKLLEFDIQTIKAAGLPVITPVIVTNTEVFEDILVSQEKEIASGDYLLTTIY